MLLSVVLSFLDFLRLRNVPFGCLQFSIVISPKHQDSINCTVSLPIPPLQVDREPLFEFPKSYGKFPTGYLFNCTVYFCLCSR